MKQYFIAFVVLVITFSCMVNIASANMAAPPDFISVVHVEQDGVPYAGSLPFMLNCYGHTTKHIAPVVYLRNKTSDEPNSPQLVFSVSHGNTHAGNYWASNSESCYPNPSMKNGMYCDIGYSTWWDLDNIEVCQLSVSSRKGEFIIWNTTGKSVVSVSKHDSFPSSHYEFFFTMPPDEQIRPAAGMPMRSYGAKSPVESLYCSFLSAFGAKC